MFTDVEGAGTVVVQKILLKILPVGFCGWVWQRGGDWWWFGPFGALKFPVVAGRQWRHQQSYRYWFRQLRSFWGISRSMQASLVFLVM